MPLPPVPAPPNFITLESGNIKHFAQAPGILCMVRQWFKIKPAKIATKIAQNLKIRILRRAGEQWALGAEV